MEENELHFQEAIFSRKTTHRSKDERKMSILTKAHNKKLHLVFQVRLNMNDKI